jgi:hypothetical protein
MNSAYSRDGRRFDLGKHRRINHTRTSGCTYLPTHACDTTVLDYTHTEGAERPFSIFTHRVKIPNPPATRKEERKQRNHLEGLLAAKPSRSYFVRHVQSYFDTRHASLETLSSIPHSRREFTSPTHCTWIPKIRSPCLNRNSAHTTWTRESSRHQRNSDVKNHSVPFDTSTGNYRRALTSYATHTYSCFYKPHDKFRTLHIY